MSIIQTKAPDVVTTATRAVMSGTYAVLSFPVAGPGSFLRAKKVWMNGIAAHVGPCPNEKLGILDFERAAKMSGSQFPLYKGAGALLELGLVFFPVSTTLILMSYPAGR